MAGIASGALAGGSYLVTSHHRLSALNERAERQAQVNLALTTARETVAQLDHLFNVYRELGGVETMAIGPGGTLRSSLPSLGPQDIPVGLRADLPDNDVLTAEGDVDGDPYLVVAGRPRESPVRLYFFFSRRGVLESLATMRNGLFVGWLVIIALAALVGRAVARATLLPVRATAEAARNIAEGLLSTRVPPGTDDEFGALATYFNRMADEVQEQIAALSEARDREKRFTAFAAHELRTPLTAMSTAASLLEEDIGELPERARRPAALLVSDVTRLRQLVLDLLELGRLDAAVDDLHLEPVDLGGLVAKVIDEARWDVDVRLDLEQVEVVSDAWSLERIMANLVGNAVRHGRRAVEVRVRPMGARAVIEVRDGGRGIPEEEIPRLFDRFYTANGARGGSGLGLAIVREHIDRIGAELDVRSLEGVGTTVTVSLPLPAG
ncbi:MAG TPA: HAMP domain-containing sensor histidine kinase [Acidimicrobiia bacterium]|nr:HAMP domain-containing sensor histidine kinase [Acidimicrobiia bacterium]